MLYRLNRAENFNEAQCVPTPSLSPNVQAVQKFDEEKDVKTAIELLYEFKAKISKLHPICMEVITRLVSERIY